MRPDFWQRLERLQRSCCIAAMCHDADGHSVWWVRASAPGDDEESVSVERATLEDALVDALDQAEARGLVPVHGPID